MDLHLIRHTWGGDHRFRGNHSKMKAFGYAAIELGAGQMNEELSAAIKEAGMYQNPMLLSRF